jgi:pimeloyl-ACP methyl ester carboxylesterase
MLIAMLIIPPPSSFSQPIRRWTWGKLQARDVRIAYVMQGAGTPVVLVHGWLSSAGINWMLPGTMAHLAKEHQVIALDVRGHGLSDKPTTEEAYGAELVEDLVRLLDHLEIKKAHILGYSMGGVIAANFIARHPDRVLSGTLCGMGWLKAGGVAQQAFRQIGRNDPDAKAHTVCGRSLAKLALTQREIESIRVPITVLVGEQDELIKKLYVEPLRRVRKDWPVIEIADANHVSCIFKLQFQREIAAWLRKNSKSQDRLALGFQAH